jgi:hypothetical protein
MVLDETLADCRFCSVVSKAVGEDPIGSADHCDQFLLIEVAQPWENNFRTTHPILSPIFQAIDARYEEQGQWVRALATAPDRDYSHPDRTRILHYYRPTELFAAYEQQEFLVPKEEVVNVAIALMQRASIPQLAAYQQSPRPTRDILVCTHGNVDVACARFGYPIYEILRNDYASETLRVWRCSHFGGHRFAPTLIDLPAGQFWGHLEPQLLNSLIYHTGSVRDLYAAYRGWAGLMHLEQIAEREAWMHEGWDWFSYCKAGKSLALDPDHEEWEEDWGEVQIQFISLDGQRSGAYQAKVEATGTVMTKGESGGDEFLEPVKQYRVCQFNRI